MEYVRISVGAILVSSVYLASGAAAQESASRGDGCTSVWVTAPTFGRPAPRPRKPLNFSAAEVLDLEFQVLVRPDLISGRNLVLKVLTPKGHLYQTLELPAPAEAPEAAKRRSRYRTLTARLPVAGTTIVNNSLYGEWKAEAYLAGERTACARGRSFVINP